MDGRDNQNFDYDLYFAASLNGGSSWQTEKRISTHGRYASGPVYKKYVCGDCLHITPGPGAGIYVGYDLEELTLIMESGKSTTFTNVPAGSFMPVSALTVCNAKAAGPVQDAQVHAPPR